mgnify:CR=1 FL=1
MVAALLDGATSGAPSVHSTLLTLPLAHGLAARRSGPLRMLVLTRGAQAGLPALGRAGRPSHGGCWGVARVLRLDGLEAGPAPRVI